ncbi:MAG TPA: Smr/MutS family protein [Firmicutes bacterium]|uniref:Smr/MutS family protein n=1 Tax=Capillibacterium thermochitinicola TaxID=2699427 RepID=A0A8J6HZ86_9FIRM|nr:Smr/MutS family protein [Capillibacterium thermochitinicola]MBA2132600.1 Smr/MutS family protein [Capillibacterium thermochitinicola]HHW11841.1 Smr/MutS family protein [Bacillota bacterium]
METIDLHGITREEAEETLERRLLSAFQYGERVVRIIHGQGKHSAYFPVLKSFVRRWLEESEFARTYVEAVYRGEDGSPYTPPNPGETVVRLKGETAIGADEEIDWVEEEEELIARKQAKKRKAQARRAAFRQPYRR